MSNAAAKPKKDKPSREERAAASLRENLHKRKQQERERVMKNDKDTK